MKYNYLAIKGQGILQHMQSINESQKYYFSGGKKGDSKDYIAYYSIYMKF